MLYHAPKLAKQNVKIKHCHGQYSLGMQLVCQLEPTLPRKEFLLPWDSRRLNETALTNLQLLVSAHTMLYSLVLEGMKLLRVMVTKILSKELNPVLMLHALKYLCGNQLWRMR